MYLSIVIFLISLAILIKGADLFSDSVEEIGMSLGIPAFIMGVTVVSIGTSLPELGASLYAVVNGAPEIVVSNAIGSNVTNILLVLGVSAVFAKKLTVTYDLIHVDLPIFIGATFIGALAIYDGHVNKFEALVMVLGLVIYLLYSISVQVSSSDRRHSDIKKELRDEHKNFKIDFYSVVKLPIGMVLMAISAKYVIDSILSISDVMGIAPEIVSITAFAVGTSLPELFVSINAAKKGYSEMVVGSILGSSIFNIFGVIGISSLFGVVTISPALLTIVLPILIVTGLMYFFITQEKEITHWEGLLLLLFYIFFIGEIIGVGYLY